MLNVSPCCYSHARLLDESVKHRCIQYGIQGAGEGARIHLCLVALLSSHDEMMQVFCLQALYSWWQYELCDVFVELVKPVIQSNSTDEQSVRDKAAFRNTLCLCLDTGLR